MARHHKSHKRHITKHDREVDRENLMHAKHHGHKKHHLSHMESEHMLRERYGGKVGGYASHGAEREHDIADRDEHRHSERAMYRAHAMRSSEHYAGMEPRRRQELEDAGMIHEDHSAVANLPQQVFYKPYAHMKNYLPEGLDDTISGVDRQMDYDDSKRARFNVPKKV